MAWWYARPADVETNKGAAETLEATRVPNTGRQGPSAPKGRIHRVKEYVNHIDAQHGNFSASLTQSQEIPDLRSNPELKQFMDCVDSVESTKDRKLLNGVEYEFGKLSEDIINAVQAVLPDKIDLHGAKHTLCSEDVWHMYRGHCLDSFIYDDQISITYDDIRMIPDIVRGGASFFL